MGEDSYKVRKKWNKERKKRNSNNEGLFQRKHSIES